MGLITNFWLAVNLGILTVDLHNLEKGSYFVGPSFFVDVDDVKKSQDSSSDPLNFVNQGRQFDLNRHEEDRDAIVEIEVVFSKIKLFLQ